MNRSKIKDTYDSNSDFDSLSESIQAGYYLKRGLSGSEEFYYMSILVTITGHSEQEVEWRSKEMTKLLSSQDIGTGSCINHCIPLFEIGACRERRRSWKFRHIQIVRFVLYMFMMKHFRLQE